MDILCLSLTETTMYCIWLPLQLHAQLLTTHEMKRNKMERKEQQQNARCVQLLLHSVAIPFRSLCSATKQRCIVQYCMIHFWSFFWTHTVHTYIEAKVWTWTVWLLEQVSAVFAWCVIAHIQAVKKTIHYFDEVSGFGWLLSSRHYKSLRHCTAQHLRQSICTQIIHNAPVQQYPLTFWWNVVYTCFTRFSWVYLAMSISLEPHLTMKCEMHVHIRKMASNK